MFDFIEEPISKEEAKPQTESEQPLGGTVYTMPSHFKATNPHVSKTPVWASVLVVLVILAVIGTGLFVFARIYYPDIFDKIYVEISQLIPNGSTVSNVGQQGNQEANNNTNSTDQASSENTQGGNENNTENSKSADLPKCGPNETPDKDKCMAEIENPDSSAVLPYVKSVDTDNDDLTDIEEKMFGTNKEKPDTDGDGYVDGSEVKFLYDPIQTVGKIEASSLVARYTNSLFKYTLLYPNSWVASPVDSSKREVLFSSSTGEFISLKTQDNPEKLSALDWYTTMEKPIADTKSLQTMSYDTWSGVMSEDNLSVYITAKDDKGNVITPYVYVLEYDLGDKKEMNFSTTFQMIIRSFLITDLSFQH